MDERGKHAYHLFNHPDGLCRDLELGLQMGGGIDEPIHKAHTLALVQHRYGDAVYGPLDLTKRSS